MLLSLCWMMTMCFREATPKVDENQNFGGFHFGDLDKIRQY